MDNTNEHGHVFTYIDDSVNEAIAKLGGDVKEAVHRLTVTHSHDDGNQPHHHTGTGVSVSAAPVNDTTKSEDKPVKRSVTWWGDKA